MSSTTSGRLFPGKTLQEKRIGRESGSRTHTHTHTLSHTLSLSVSRILSLSFPLPFSLRTCFLNWPLNFT